MRLANLSFIKQYHPSYIADIFTLTDGNYRMSFICDPGNIRKTLKLYFKTYRRFMLRQEINQRKWEKKLGHPVPNYWTKIQPYFKHRKAFK